MSSDLHPVYDSEAYKSLARAHSELAAKVYGTGGLEERVSVLEHRMSQLCVAGDGSVHLQAKESKNA